jgi:hypothetical protein
LKKRTKKLLSVAGGTILPNGAEPGSSKQKFFGSFFQKELLSFYLDAS